MNIIREYMERRGTLKQKGKWATGPCPRCGGEDRFRVVDNGDSEFYECRQCGARGDTIQFLRDFRGMAFRAAKAMVDARNVASDLAMPAIEVDDDRWFEGAAGLVERASSYLGRSERAQRLLRETRGITLDTAEAHGLGYVPRPVIFDREAFGLPPRRDGDGREKPLYIPQGIAIPILVNGELHGLQVRRDEPWNGMRYYTVPGSHLVPMLFRGESSGTVIVVESYLDGVFLHQETQGRYTVVALGSAAVRPRGGIDALLRRADMVLVALDTDAAGAAQAWRYWAERYPNAARCPIPARYGKDPTEAHINGLDLSEWVEAGIALAREDGPSNGSRTVTVGGENATVKGVSTADEAVEAVDRIVEGCEAVGVAVEVEPREGSETHPHAGWLPGLSRVRRVAVYARALREVTVFEMGAVKKKHLRPLWSRTVVCHDGVELMRHVAGLRKGDGRVESTVLMANALTNERLDLADAMECFVGTGADECHDAARRAVALGPLLDALRKKLKGGRGRAYRRMRDAQRAVTSMELAGFAFDAAAHGALVSGWREALRKGGEGLPDGLDAGDDKAVRAWVESRLPAETVKRMARTNRGDVSLADANLASCNVPVVDALRECRRLAKLVERHAGLPRFADPGTGRVHADYLIGGAVTGRAVNRKPCLHNLPRGEGLRELFRAGDGCRLVVADVSQSQLRIAAAVSGDDAMLEAYRSDGDLHAATAAAIAGVAVDDVTAEQRHAAKAANFGLLFGQGTEGFRDHAARVYGVAMTGRETEGVRRAFREAYPRLADWQEETIESVAATGGCATPGGRVRRFDQDAGDEAARQALAFVIQGAEAEVMLDALAALHAGLEAMGARLVHFVHDEVVVEAPGDDETLATLAGAVSGHIADAFRRMFPDAPTEGLVETRFSDTWGKGE